MSQCDVVVVVVFTLGQTDGVCVCLCVCVEPEICGFVRGRIAREVSLRKLKRQFSGDSALYPSCLHMRAYDYGSGTIWCAPLARAALHSIAFLSGFGPYVHAFERWTSPSRFFPPNRAPNRPPRLASCRPLQSHLSYRLNKSAFRIIRPE